MRAVVVRAVRVSRFTYAGDVRNIQCPCSVDDRSTHELTSLG